jgi:hypothetical protein
VPWIVVGTVVMADLLITLLAAVLFVSAADCLPFCVHPAFTPETRHRLSLVVGCGFLIAVVAVGYGVAGLKSRDDAQSHQSAFNDDVLER